MLVIGAKYWCFSNWFQLTNVTKIRQFHKGKAQVLNKVARKARKARLAAISTTTSTTNQQTQKVATISHKPFHVITHSLNTKRFPGMTNIPEKEVFNEYFIIPTTTIISRRTRPRVQPSFFWQVPLRKQIILWFLTTHLTSTSPSVVAWRVQRFLFGVN